MKLATAGYYLLLLVLIAIAIYGAIAMNEVKETDEQTVVPTIGADGTVWDSASVPIEPRHGRVRSEHVRDTAGHDLHSFARGPGISIDWATLENPNGAMPIDVADALMSRLQHMQKTSQGGNDVAKAIWEVDKLMQLLTDPKPFPKAEPVPDPGSNAGFPPPKPELKP